jgi:high-affinity nickel-transport protein
MNLVGLLSLGFLLGLRHATDPDHMVAVSAMAAQTRRVSAATRLGMAWGLGHSLTLFVVAGAIILFNWVVPPRLGLALEFGVALALIAVGLMNLRHRSHDHAAFESEAPRPPAGRAFIVGIVHGLAGSAAAALLVLATIRDPRWACVYLLVFGAGTLMGMALITTGLVIPLSSATRRWADTGRLVRVSTGVLSLISGVWLAYQIGWHDGLFLATVSWLPR